MLINDNKVKQILIDIGELFSTIQFYEESERTMLQSIGHSYIDLAYNEILAIKYDGALDASDAY